MSTGAGRLAALLWLIAVVGDGLSVRALLEAREKEVTALKKQLAEDTRVSSAGRRRAAHAGGQARRGDSSTCAH